MELYFCEECGEFVTPRWESDENFRGGGYLECPNCRSEQLTLAKKCPVCDGPMREDRVLCKECEGDFWKELRAMRHNYSLDEDEFGELLTDFVDFYL